MAQDRTVRDHIAEWLPLFFDPEDVLEIRVLDAGRPGRKVAGWLTAKHIPALAKKISDASANASGTYFTPHVLDRSILGRCSHNLIGVGKDMRLTRDVDVTARRYLIIDIDPVRPANTSATEAEKEAAAEVANAVRNCLAGHGWPPPLVVDSGNGLHLYYRLSTALHGGSVKDPVADELAACLRVLAAKFDTDKATVDTSVYNSSRIMKVPGTWARKGTHSAERPHRQCKITEHPDDWKTAVAPMSLADLVDALDPDKKLREAMKNRNREGSANASPTIITAQPIDPDGLPALPFRLHRARKYLRTIDPGVQGKYGSNPTLWAARVLVHGYCLDENSALALMLTEYNPRCNPPWDVKRLEHKIKDALERPFRKPRGWLLMKNDGPPVSLEMPSGLLPPSELATSTPASVDPVCVVPNKTPSEFETMDPDAPIAERVVAWAKCSAGGQKSETRKPCNAADDDPTILADEFLSVYHRQGRLTLAFWNGEFYEWSGSSYERYKSKTGQSLSVQVARVVERHLKAVHAMRLAEAGKDEKEELPKLTKLSRVLVGNVMMAIESRCAVQVSNPPAWIGRSGPDPTWLHVTPSGIFNLAGFLGRGSVLVPRTPDLFTMHSVAYQPSADAILAAAIPPHMDGFRPYPKPVKWLNFLNQLWPDDPGSIALLQEWFGYLLTPDTSQEKILLLLGPRRAGKGTIVTVLNHLVGDSKCGATSLRHLGGDHGGQSLLGKTVAVLGDSRTPGHKFWDPATATELLLLVAGRDKVSINQKNNDYLHELLPLRFVISSNELPALPDESGALAERYSPICFKRTFKDCVDPGLKTRLLGELPEIFYWAVEGLQRLHRNGKFTAPEASVAKLREIAESDSPVTRFVNDCCDLRAGSTCLKAELFSAWEKWCRRPDNSQVKTGNIRTFATSLKDRFGGVIDEGQSERPNRREIWKDVSLNEVGLKLIAEADDRTAHERNLDLTALFN